MVKALLLSFITSRLTEHVILLPNPLEAVRSSLIDMLDKSVLVILRDGKKLVGKMRCAMLCFGLLLVYLCRKA